MINRAMLLLAIVLSLAACSSSKKTVEDTDNATDNGAWQQQQVIADGNSKEWDKNNMSFDQAGKIAYKITNDDKNLYVLITTTDHTSQTKILRAGMSVFIDPAAKKNETIAVNFPIGSGDVQDMSEAPQQQVQPGDKPDLQQMRAKALINANQYTLSGFSKGSGGYGINQGNAAGVSVKIDIDTSGVMVYEAVIPMQSLTQHAVIFKAGTPISVGFKINALPKPAMNGAGNGGYSGGGGMRGAGGGGMHGGGMRGGGGRGGTAGSNYAARQQLFKEVKIWKHLVLAQKEAQTTKS